MGILMMMCRGKYVNEDAVENVIHYITRSRVNEGRREELMGYGGAGVGIYLLPDQIIGQFLYIQKVHGIDARKRRRVYHEVFGLQDSEFAELNCDMDVLHRFARECCQVYYQRGYQVVYAIHWEPFNGKKMHIHFAVNTISFRDGKKWHTSKVDLRERERLFNGVLDYYQKAMLLDQERI